MHRQRGSILRGRMPDHVGIIMDGNGRWARQHGLRRVEGHRKGARALRSTIEECISLGIGHLSAFAFSTENWERPREEVEALMGLMVEFAAVEAAELAAHGVRVISIGDVASLPAPTRRELQRLSEFTRAGENLILMIAVNYGGRDEVHRAARKLATRVIDGEIAPEDIDEDQFRSHLYTHPYPDPDLIIRTGGEWRLSNFLLYQAAYAEFVSTPVLWPDFSPADLHDALRTYQSRERRFGQIHDDQDGGTSRE